MKARRIILRDDADARWLELKDLREQRACDALGDVLALVDWAEQQAKQGLWVAGFIRYEAAPACDEALSPMPADASELPLAEYQQRFDRVKDYLVAGDSYQVNLTFRLRGQFDGDCFGLFSQLCANQAGRFSAYLEFEEHCVMSASPELFFERRDSLIQTRPMKGTVRRGVDAAEDKKLADFIRNDPKNQAENLMIVDMIRNDLGRIADVGSVEVPVLFEVEQYPRIQQMTTTVTALSDKPLSALIEGLFPCASITGAPKARTVEIIAELEESPRELYTGTIGLIRPGGDCQFSVVIRTAVWSEATGELVFGVGSGVVFDSTGDDEHQESLLKANILEAGADVGLFETMYWHRDGGYRFASAHAARLSTSAEALGIPFDLTAFEQLLAEVPSDDEEARVRIDLHADGQFTHSVGPAPEAVDSMRVAFCPWPVDSSWPLLQYKRDSRALYQDAAEDTANCDHALLWNEKGNVTEGVYANVVIREGEDYFTPPVSDGLLPGVMRGELLAEGKLRTQSISKARLIAADEVWLINALRGWVRAEFIGA